MNAMEEMHLTIETKIDGDRIDIHDIHDPFLHNRTTLDLSLWEWFRLLWKRRIEFSVKVRGDDIAHRQWFRTDPLPRGEHGGPLQAKQTVQDATHRE